MPLSVLASPAGACRGRVTDHPGTGLRVHVGRMAIVVLAITGLLLPSVGCSNRPAPTFVKKDKSNKEDNDYPVFDLKTGRPPADAAGAKPMQNAVDATPVVQADPTGVVPESAAAPSKPGQAPFDTKFLPADSELIVSIEAAELARSPLIHTLTGGNVAQLTSLIGGLGVNIGEVEWIRIGIRNLEEVPLPSPQLFKGNLQGGSLLALAAHPNMDSTIVLKSTDRIDVGMLRANGDEAQHNNKTYYRLRTNQFDTPCAYVTQRRILIVAGEATIQSIISSTRPPQPIADLSFARNADLVVALTPKDPEVLSRWFTVLPLIGQLDSTTAVDAVMAQEDIASTDAVTGVPADGDAVKPEVAAADETQGTERDEASSESAGLLALLHKQGKAMAFHMNASDGVGFNLSVRCDSPEAASQLNDAAKTTIAQLHSWVEKQTGIPQGLVDLAKTMRPNALQSVAVITASVPAAHQADVAQLPGLVMGMTATDSSSAPQEMSSTPKRMVSGEVQVMEPVLIEAEPGPEIPEGLSIEAHARWDDPDTKKTTIGSSALAQPVMRKRVTGEDKDDDSPRASRPGLPRIGVRPRQSENPMRILVDLTGKAAEETDAIGKVALTSIETDMGSELIFEGAFFRNQSFWLDDGVEFLPVPLHSKSAVSESLGGLRLSFHFTPPLQPVNQILRFNGTATLRISRDRRETVITKVHDRTGRRITDRELSQLGIVLMAGIKDSQILVRLLEGNDEQISQITPVDAYGDPISGVTKTSEQGSGNARGRLVHTLTFANGVPAGVGLRVFANSGVSEVNVPFRFSNIPVPPRSIGPISGLSQR